MTQTTSTLLTCWLFFCPVVCLQAQDQALTYSTQSPVQTQVQASTPSQAPTSSQSLSESDTAIATRRAIMFADSLVKANFIQDWKTYTALSNLSAISFYGGKDRFRDHLVTVYNRTRQKIDEKAEAVQLINMMNEDGQWQCVVQKVRETIIDDTWAKVYSYLIGESVDNGVTWKFIDVSHNSVENVINIMPSIFLTMAVPEGKVEYGEKVPQSILATLSPVKKKPAPAAKTPTAAKTSTVAKTPTVVKAPTVTKAPVASQTTSSTVKTPASTAKKTETAVKGTTTVKAPTAVKTPAPVKTPAAAKTTTQKASASAKTPVAQKTPAVVKTTTPTVKAPVTAKVPTRL